MKNFLGIVSVKRCMTGNVCCWIVASLGRSVSESLRNQGEQEASLSLGDCWAINWCEIDLRQGSHQIVYALSVFIGPSSFWLHLNLKIILIIFLFTVERIEIYMKYVTLFWSFWISCPLILVMKSKVHCILGFVNIITKLQDYTNRTWKA